jgi:MFS family permease
VLGPSVAREQYGGVGVYGVVAAAFGAGTIAGALLGISWRPRRPMRMAVAFAVPWPLSTILYALGITLFVVIPASVIAGAGIALFDVWWLTALAERLPADRLSRVTAYDWLVSLALLPLGYLLAGPLAGALGAVPVLLGGSVLASVALALGLLPRETRSLERIDGEENQLPTGATWPASSPST